MSTHPSTPERIQKAVLAARQIGGPGVGKAARTEYLDALNGMDFGDDPTDGVIRGRKFSHPRFGFGFVAPEGFVLENTSQAVLGVADGGSQALRLDSVQISADTPLDTYLASGWIEGLDKTSIQSNPINGLPAATATAKSGDWSFRVAAIRLNNDVYRMIYATRDLSVAADRRYRDAVESFHRIPADEAAKLRPLRLSVVQANAGDSAHDFATRMAQLDRPQDQFLLLNGLDKDGPLKVGERYKIVVE
jgi:predicted Zn-dependent protease